jgi:hypothetical protein
LLAKVLTTLNNTIEILTEIGDKDCYDRMSQSSMPRKIEKNDFAKYYGIEESDLMCMVTEISQSLLIASSPKSQIPPNPLKLSHILARSADLKERENLSFADGDIDNIRNTIILCKGIEEAFDRKKLSFVPSEQPFSPHRYKLHIWLDSVRTTPIYPVLIDITLVMI